MGMDVYLIPTLNCLNKTSGYTEARIITSEPNSLTEQDTVKVSERLVGKQLYSAFQLLCITMNLYNNKRDKFYSASTPPVEHERLSRGKDMEIYLRCSQRITRA